MLRCLLLSVLFTACITDDDPVQVEPHAELLIETCDLSAGNAILEGDLQVDMSVGEEVNVRFQGDSFANFDTLQYDCGQWKVVYWSGNPAENPTEEIGCLREDGQPASQLVHITDSAPLGDPTATSQAALIAELIGTPTGVPGSYTLNTDLEHEDHFTCARR